MRVSASLCWVLALVVAVVILSASAASPAIERRQGCQANNGTAQVLDVGTRRAVGATALTVGTVNVDLIYGAQTVVEFDPPFDPAPRIISGQCACGSIINGMLCDATFFFPASPLAESLVGRNITARVSVSGVYVTNWTRVAVVMPAPVLTASNATWSQYGENFTVHGQHLGLPVGGVGAVGGEDDDLHLYFTDSNGTAIAARVMQVSDDATWAQVQFDAGWPALGPLWARAELWGSGLTDAVQVGTVVRTSPDATSTLNCSVGASKTANAAISMDEAAQLNCIVYVQGDHQPVAIDNLDDFSFYLGVGSHGLLGKASLRADKKSIEFNYTAPDTEGVEMLHVTLHMSTEIVGSPLNITITQHKSNGGSDVPWHIIIPVSAAGGGLVLIAFVIAWVVWVRRRRRCHYEVINATHH